MKRTIGISAWIAVTVLVVCLAPTLLAQNATSSLAGGVMTVSSMWMPTIPMQFAQQPTAVALLFSASGNKGNKGGGGKGNGGGGGKGNGGGGGKGNGGGGGHCTVPEGGSALAHLMLAGSACLIAFVYRRRKNYAL